MPTLRESDIIAIYLDILIFTSKKTRSCSEFCVEGNTPWMFHYGHGGQMHRKPNSCDADPVLLTHVSQNGQRSKTLRRVFQKSFKRHMDLFSEDLASCMAGDHSRPHCILARRCKQSASISNSKSQTRCTWYSTWHPGRVEVDINSSEFLESKVPHRV